METDLESQVISFIAKQSGNYSFELSLKTELQYDLEIWGDDAVEFLLAFSKEFDVKINRFEAAKFFRRESFYIFSIVVNHFKLDKKKYHSITISDLVESVKLGELHHENILKKST